MSHLTVNSDHTEVELSPDDKAFYVWLERKKILLRKFFGAGFDETSNLEELKQYFFNMHPDINVEQIENDIYPIVTKFKKREQ